MSRIASILLLTLAFTGLAACSDAPPPNKDTEKHTELRDAIQTPLNKARAVDATVQKAKEEQDKNLDAQVNGQAPAANQSSSNSSGSQ
jgi:hypothetical protein